MARPRTPTMKAQVTGAALRNAGRYAGRTTPSGATDIGQPPDCLTPAQADAWRAFVAELPWLNSGHRAVLQIAAVLRARLVADPEMGVAALSAYSSILSKLGATPADESRVTMAEPVEDDPAERFFRH